MTTNLNADFSKGLFAETNTVLTELERAQLSNLRIITQNYTETGRMKEILAMTPTRLSNVPENMLNDINAFLAQTSSSLAAATSEQSILACKASESLVASIANNVSTDYTVFITKNAMDTYLKLCKDMCMATAKHLRPTFMTDESTMENQCSVIIESIKKNVAIHDPYNEVSNMYSLQQYVSLCADAAKMFVSSNPVYDNVKQRQIIATFMVAFYPYLICLYISGYIRTSGETEASNKPASFVVRQFAVLSLKMFMVQTMLLLITLCSTVSLRNTLKTSVKTLLRSIADEYNTQEEFDTYYQQIMQLASDNKATREAIETITIDVNAAKNNVEKATANDQRAVGAVKSAQLLMYIWLALLLIFIVAAVVLILLGKPENNMFYYLYVLCGVFLVPVFINGMVQIVRSG